MNSTDSQNNTVLITSALFGDVDIMRLLIEAGADVNLWNNSGMTALMGTYRRS